MKKPLDYSPYYLDAKAKLKEVHELLNKNNFIDAASIIDEIIVELRMMRAAVKSHVEK